MADGAQRRDVSRVPIADWALGQLTAEMWCCRRVEAGEETELIGDREA